jgi:hypothetical protein
LRRDIRVRFATTPANPITAGVIQSISGSGIGLGLPSLVVGSMLPNNPPCSSLMPAAK